jgi:hypothetical protein
LELERMSGQCYRQSLKYFMRRGCLAVAANRRSAMIHSLWNRACPFLPQSDHAEIQ